ncbi:IclR family transcriptional regulator [Amycolatopsis acididurans]|nr:IclR family transcriptional regulator [Amycolatopsis acididurans]
MPEVAEQSGVKSARRTVELLEAFAVRDAWLSLSELHTITGIPRSSLHGLLRTLTEAGWLEADAAATRYRLGMRALLCGTAYLDRDPAMRFARETLEDLRERTGFTAHYARRDGGQIVYLETRESRNAKRSVSRVGRALPAYSTALGKALLAELTQDEIAALYPERLISLTPNTLTSVAALRQECDTIRRRGFATEVEESTAGLRCVAAVVPYRIPGTDALSCAIPVDEVTDAEAVTLGEILAETAANLGRRLRHAGIR